ncbi:MAG: DUF1003 domain-containing protein [Thermoanaerobaculia bacterium]
MSQKRESAACQICGTAKHGMLRRAMIVRPAIADLIREEKGSFDERGWICLDDLDRLQARYVHSLVESEEGELTALDLEVLRSLEEQEILSRNPDAVFDAKLSFGDRLSDRIADFGGSWTFIIIFAILLFSWMLINSALLVVHPFDPYPFILLNLVLSTLAAIQAPVIMMSQNRQEARDRERAVHDYQVNLKAELEIRQLHQKIDHLLSHQWERLVEIQEIQMELMEEMRKPKGSGTK